MNKYLVNKNNNKVLYKNNFIADESNIFITGDNNEIIAKDRRHNRFSTYEIMSDKKIYWFPNVWIWAKENEDFYLDDNGETFIQGILRPKILNFINTRTSKAIISGFDYVIKNQKLHFSYDSFDQQNFADTANACLMLLAGTEKLPTEITWNGYLEDGTLKRITLNAQEFLQLYTEGALAHKATCMEEGGVLKARVNSCTTMEILELMDEIGIENYEILD